MSTQFISYGLKINEPGFGIDELIDFFWGKKFSERNTFVWLCNPQDQWRVRGIKDRGGKTLCAKKNCIYWLFGRPIFYATDVKEGWLLFREYV